MTTWKPYIYEKDDYFQAVQKQSFEDATDHQNVPRSEFDKPYQSDSYQEYEWGWPGGWPPINIDFPEWPWPWDPGGGGGPCDAEDGCGFIKIIGAPDELECDKEYTFRTVHVVYGCDLPGWGDAFIGWQVSAGEIISVGVIMHYRAPSCCDGQKVVITAIGPYDCEDSVEIPLKCDCPCGDSLALTGADTVNPAATWTGTITPACPEVICSVESNSGCTLSCSVSGDGTQVTVTPLATDCGSFTVTLTQPGDDEECPPASKTVRINNTGQGGSWVSLGNTSCGTCGGCAGQPGIDPTPANCTEGKYQYAFVGGAPSSVQCCANPPHPPRCCDPVAYCTDVCAGVAPCGVACSDYCNDGNCNIPPGTWTGECKMTWTTYEWKCSC